MKMTEKKITFGVIVGTRGFFNAELAKQGRKDLLAIIWTGKYTGINRFLLSCSIQ